MFYLVWLYLTGDAITFELEKLDLGLVGEFSFTVAKVTGF